MTAAVLPFTPRPAFASIVEALDFYAIEDRRDQLMLRARPPLDAVGDEGGDAYLCWVFLALPAIPSLSGRIFHLAHQALDLCALSVRLHERGHVAEAELQRRMACVVSGWRDQLSDHALNTVSGGAA